jgi:hypothetical protein
MTHEAMILELNAYKETRKKVSSAMRPIFTRHIIHLERELGLR